MLILIDMTVSPLNILSLLLLKFQSYGKPPDNPENASRKEITVAAQIASIITQVIEGDMEISEREELMLEGDEDYNDYDFDACDDFDYSPQRQVAFGKKFVSRESVFEAIKFYRSATKKSRSLKSMQSKFRWITTEYDLIKLRKIEQLGDDFQGDRLRQLKMLGRRLFEVVKEKLEEGICLHDYDLKTIARTINTEETKIEKFLASASWITRWKQKYRIVSRRVTKFTTRKCIANKADLDKKANDFVQSLKSTMSNYLSCQIFNADQTGVQKELYSARALAMMGEKIITRLAQAKASLTHSFTFLPMTFLDGTLGPKAFLVFSEPTGQFPPTRPIPDTPNLVVRAGRSHIMTKDLMVEWLKECVYIPGVPKTLLMVVDSWPSFRDHKKIVESAPPGFDIVVKNIPPGCTSLIQPLDVYFNGPWKSLIKRFTNYAITHRHKTYIIATRNNLIRMVSALYHQISAKRFKEFLRYSWKKAGYIDTYLPFVTPLEYCFGHVDNSNCYHHGCKTPAFIRCARCEEHICFEHFSVEDLHICDVD